MEDGGKNIIFGSGGDIGPGLKKLPIRIWSCLFLLTNDTFEILKSDKFRKKERYSTSLKLLT
jgi:hypothetical protein